ncbi:peroxidasin-like isoform X1 [Mytilus edulis]|uniref:peroxidasin-like isoform X1 n=1 Tax=Mytilus edulis TaxID=6550 RepID=UPI0039F00622
MSTYLTNVIIFLTCFMCVDLQQSDCPHKCVCFRSTVRCMFAQLDAVPSQIPKDTTVLDLRFNSLSQLNRGSFIGLHKIDTLLLNNNKLRRLTNGVFEGLTNLRFLYLYQNELEEIERDVFADTQNLEQLFLHSNKIKHLPDGLFSQTNNLQRLRLDDNPVDCGCKMHWLYQLLHDRNRNVQGAVTCKGPPTFAGRALNTLDENDFQCDERTLIIEDNRNSNTRPQIITEPSAVNVTFGNTAYFVCRAEGTPRPEITWLHNEYQLDFSDPRINQLEDGTLMIYNTKESDRGDYQCMARNPSGEVKAKKVQLRYSEAEVSPRFVATPQDVTTSVGNSVQLTCQATGHPEPQIQWTKNGNQLSPSNRISVMSNGDLHVNNVHTEDQGLYRCTGVNSAGSIGAAARISVHEPPKFLTEPSDVQVTGGSTATFRCEVSGTPTPRIIWIQGVGSPLPREERFDVQNDGRLLQIRYVEEKDKGLYTCRAINDVATVEVSAELTILQQSTPIAASRESTVDTYAGADIILHCTSDGEPTPQFRWIKDGTFIQNSHKFSLQGNRMIIRNVLQSDQGSYECYAENTVGFARNTVALRVFGEEKTYPGNRFVQQAIEQATQRVDTAINQTRAQYFNKDKKHSVQDMLAIFRYPSADALGIARAEEIFEQTLQIIHDQVKEGHQYDLQDAAAESYTDIISPGHLMLIANMSGCLSVPRDILNCNNMCYHRKYRTLDGTCNNLQNPTWGSSVTGFKRLLPPIYENGFNTPVGWTQSKLYNGIHLPSPRLVSSLLMSTDHVTEDEKYTHMLMQWGQFADHDMDLTPQSISYAQFSDGRRCNETCDKSYPCYPIPVPRSDNRITSHACLGFTRSSALCNSGSTSIFYKTFAPREQLNVITAFIDGSSVYGSSDFEAQRLRESTGLMRVGVLSTGGKRLLPFDNSGFLHHLDCQVEPNKKRVPCFRAGDPRANEQIALTAMHTLFMRYHNHLVSRFSLLNPHWDGNMLYHETRKVMGAIMQHITYHQWLPKIIGESGMKKLGLYRLYDPNVNPSIANEFATAAFRFGHSLIQPIILRLNESFQPIPEGNLPLHQAFFSPHRIIEEGGIDPILRGLVAFSAKKRMPDEMMNSELTEKLFSLANVVGQDLASLNIQRGRDHALPFYNEYRKLCGLQEANVFSDLRNEISPRVLSKLQDLYNHPGNIDLFVGGMAETPLEGAKVGPTFMCIIVDQFKRLRDGDRFWYENPGVFTVDQLSAIKQMTLSSVLCDGGDNINKVQKDVFLRVHDKSEYLSCDKIPKLNVNMWSDCCADCSKAGDFQSITSQYSRSRQSRQFSFRNDFTQLQNDGPRQPVRHEFDRTVYDDQIKVFNNHIHQFETRIDNMETTISDLTDSMTFMEKKMKKMHRQMKHQKKFCKDETGRKRRDQDTWKVDDCKTCLCKKGTIECEKEVCEVTHNCERPTQVPGECCPRC